MTSEIHCVFCQIDQTVHYNIIADVCTTVHSNTVIFSIVVEITCKDYVLLSTLYILCHILSTTRQLYKEYKVHKRFL